MAAAILERANAPLRVDPIALAAEAQPKLTSTGQFLDAINRLRAGDPRRRMNGGGGYSTEFHHDERDDEDAERAISDRVKQIIADVQKQFPAPD